VSGTCHSVGTTFCANTPGRIVLRLPFTITTRETQPIDEPRCGRARLFVQGQALPLTVTFLAIFLPVVNTCGQRSLDVLRSNYHPCCGRVGR